MLPILLAALVAISTPASSATPDASNAPAVDPSGPAPIIPVDLLPLFFDICMRKGPDPGVIDKTLQDLGATRIPDAPGSPRGQASGKTAGYVIEQSGNQFSVMVDARMCTLAATHADVEKTRTSLGLLTSHMPANLTVTADARKDPAPGETIVSSYRIEGAGSKAHVILSLSTAERDGKPSVFLSQLVIADAPGPGAGKK